MLNVLAEQGMYIVLSLGQDSQLRNVACIKFDVNSECSIYISDCSKQLATIRRVDKVDCKQLSKTCLVLKISWDNGWASWLERNRRRCSFKSALRASWLWIDLSAFLYFSVKSLCTRWYRATCCSNESSGLRDACLEHISFTLRSFAASSTHTVISVSRKQFASTKGAIRISTYGQSRIGQYPPGS